MQPYPRRHRYPKKRNIPKILLLVSLPVLLVLLLIGASSLFSDTPPSSGMNTAQTPPGTTDPPQAEAYPQGPLTAWHSFDRLVLEKEKRRLTAYAKGEPVRVYLVALGREPVGPKEYQGDMRTPEGQYIINDKNPNSAYYKNLGISYPAPNDRARAEKSGRDPGGDIKIHGLAPAFAKVGRFHRVSDWTYGCIAVTNEEMEELFQRTPVGTTIEILP